MMCIMRSRDCNSAYCMRSIILSRTNSERFRQALAVTLESMEYRKKSRRASSLASMVVLLCRCVPILCLLLLLRSSLPEASIDHGEGTYREFMPMARSPEVELGELGKLMVAMLPDDLAFTVFAPSDEAFARFLNLRPNDSRVGDRMNDTFAILSRVMGFSAVPRHLPSRAIPLLKEISFDSVSGYRVYAWKASNGTLFVNNVRSERVDMRMGEAIVHIMSGVIMDPEFGQSFQIDEDD